MEQGSRDERILEYSVFASDENIFRFFEQHGRPSIIIAMNRPPGDWAIPGPENSAPINANVWRWSWRGLSSLLAVVELSVESFASLGATLATEISPSQDCYPKRFKVQRSW